MRHIIGIFFLVAILFSAPARAGQGVHITASATTITASFQRFLTMVNPAAKHMSVFNGCAVPIALTFTNSSANVTPSASTTTNPQQLFFGPSSLVTDAQNAGAGKFVWVRADTTGGATCTTGDVLIDFW
jgi:hypothetical protein